MRAVKIHEAKTHFSQLIANVEQGEEIIVQRGDVKVARIVPYGAPVKARQAGALKGRITIADDFDAIPPEFDGLLG